MPWGEFEIAHTDDVGKANIKGGHIGLRWSKTHTGSKNGFPINQNRNKAYMVLPDNVARLLPGALLGIEILIKRRRSTNKLNKQKGLATFN